MNIEPLLIRALEADLGIVVLTTDAEALKRSFYTFRNAARANGDDLFNRLSLITSPDNPDEYWIVKGLNNGA